MKKFSDFADDSNLEGDKIKISDILDKEIVLLDFKIDKSKLKSNEDYLILQFKYLDEKHVLFTGSNVLINQCKKYKNEIPFLTKTIKVDKYFTFS